MATVDQGDERAPVSYPTPRSSGPGAKLVQFSSGLSKPFIQRPVMTMLLTMSIIVFGILTFKQLAVNDLPAVDQATTEAAALHMV